MGNKVEKNIESKMCLLTIKKRYGSLTAAEKVVADYILQHSDEVVFMPIATLAKNSNSAKSAIIRCCKSLGFEGYSDLKIALAMELSKNKKLNYSPYISPNDDVGAIMDKLFAANIKAFHDTAEKINRTVLQEAVTLLNNANMVYIYAIGTSSEIANDFQCRLMQIGKASLCISDVPTMKISTLNITEKDVAIGISHSGNTIPTIDSLKLAKANGAKTLCLTSSPGSAITKIADLSIEIFSDEIDYPMEAISARIVHLGVLDVLTIGMSAKNYDNAVERTKKIHELVNTMRI